MTASKRTSENTLHTFYLDASLLADQKRHFEGVKMIYIAIRGCILTN